MLVQRIQNNNYNQNFTARSNIRMRGHFKRNRDLAQKVIDELNQRETFKKFSDDYQTKIILDRYLTSILDTETMLWIRYKSKPNESSNKVVNFFKRAVQPLKPHKTLSIAFFDGTTIEGATDTLINEIKLGNLDKQIHSVYKSAK